MFLLNLLLAFCIFESFIHARTIPVNLLRPNLNSSGTLLDPTHAKRSTTEPILFDDEDSHLTLNDRPQLNKIYPALRKGDHHVRFHDYGKDIPSDSEGASVFYEATHQVDDWIDAARKHTYTPVEGSHSWRSGSIELTIAPNTQGYLLGDLKYYLALMTAFHAKYGAFWEWEAQLIDNSGTFGFLKVVGKASLKLH
ncbi:MAG: hypothetical protein LQ346_000817 [Caloplaca aetnensis]|nr:MAG: hypothetical protein LQ346_000817 [Caloplaca aetnensis]